MELMLMNIAVKIALKKVREQGLEEEAGILEVSFNKVLHDAIEIVEELRTAEAHIDELEKELEKAKA